MAIEIKCVRCGMIQENAWIVRAEGRDDCAVIDPGDEYPKLAAALGTLRVGAILLTHGHFDHIGAVAPMARESGAAVYCAREDMEMLNDAALNGLTDLMGGGRKGPEIAAEPFGETLSACGLTFQVLRTPGHSRGSVCLYLPGEGVLFSGDTLFEAGYGRLDLHGGSPADMRQSLRALFALPGETRVYPGHGGSTTIARERARYRL